MGNLLNHKCLITKRAGNFQEEDLVRIIGEIETNNHIYSDYYVSIINNTLKIEYVAKYYSKIFEDENFLKNYKYIDIYSDSGGAEDTINVTQSSKKARYKFDEIRIGGKNIGTKQEEQDIIKYSGRITANTYNEEITEISNNAKTIKFLDDNIENNRIKESLEIRSIEIDDITDSKNLLDTIEHLHQNSIKRSIDNIGSIAFLYNQIEYFTIYKNSDKTVWNETRKFDLWEILDIKEPNS